MIEVVRDNGTFSYVRGSEFNRRVAANTLIELSGVARGSILMRTSFSPDGTHSRGTFWNCGSGKSPWGTYLSGEENASLYFYRRIGDDAARGGPGANAVVSLHRYNRGSSTDEELPSLFGWETSGAEDQFARFDVSKTGTSEDGSDDYRNELNAHGYVIELDPFSPEAPIKKRTSLGRMAHESASFGVPRGADR